MNKRTTPPAWTSFLPGGAAPYGEEGATNNQGKGDIEMKFNVYAIATASKYLGEVEANSISEAKDKAWDLENCYMESLCWHCASVVDIGDVYEIQAEEA